MKPALITGVAILALAAAQPVHAAELKVLAGGSMTSALKDLAPRFEKATGHKLNITLGATPELIKMAASEPFDLGVVPIDVLKDSTARAKFTDTFNVVRVGYGVAVRAGAPKPDVGTPEKLKAALLKAQSIAYIPSSAAGAYVTKVFERLGIADEMKAKTKVQTKTEGIPQAVASGEAELGVFLTNVLTAPGVELAGAFPGDLQQELVFVGGRATDSKEAAPAQAFLDYLKTPEAVALLKAKGLTPG